MERLQNTPQFGHLGVEERLKSNLFIFFFKPSCDTVWDAQIWLPCKNQNSNKLIE